MSTKVQLSRSFLKKGGLFVRKYGVCCIPNAWGSFGRAKNSARRIKSILLCHYFERYWWVWAIYFTIMNSSNAGHWACVRTASNFFGAGATCLKGVIGKGGSIIRFADEKKCVGWLGGSSNNYKSKTGAKKCSVTKYERSLRVGGGNTLGTTSS